MPWPKGKSKEKTGGRQPGSRNKQSVGRAAREIFEQHDFCALEQAIEFVQNETVEMPLRVSLLKEILKYQHPQLKSVELSGKDGRAIELIAISSDERQRRIKELIEKRELASRGRARPAEVSGE